MPRLTVGRLRVILAVSIALNLFLVALVGAQRWRAVQRMATSVSGLIEAQGMHDPEGTLQDFVARLSRDDAAILQSAARARMGELLKARRDFVAAVQRTRAEIARDPVDPTGVREAISEARRQRQRFGPLLEGILLDAVPRMTPEGRRALSRAPGVAAP